MDPEEARVPKSMSYDLNRSNALSHHVPTLDAIEGYNLDADLLVGRMHQNLSIDHVYLNF